MPSWSVLQLARLVLLHQRPQSGGFYSSNTWAMMGQIRKDVGCATNVIRYRKQGCGLTGTGDNIPYPPPLDPTGNVSAPFSPPWG